MEKIPEIVNQKCNSNAVPLPRNRVSPSNMHAGCLLASSVLDERTDFQESVRYRRSGCLEAQSLREQLSSLARNKASCYCAGRDGTQFRRSAETMKVPQSHVTNK